MIVVSVINLVGLKMGRQVIDVLVIFKLSIMAIIILLGFSHFDISNFQPFLLNQTDGSNTGGINGIFLGATAGFFGFVGFDEICCLGGETKNPEKNIPLAVLTSVLCVTAIYAAAALSLNGMIPIEQISSDEGFGSAFQYS